MSTWNLMGDSAKCPPRKRDTPDVVLRRKLPLDLTVQDWQYWGHHGWNAMRFDEEQYPDPAGLVRELHGMDARLMLSVWGPRSAARRSLNRPHSASGM